MKFSIRGFRAILNRFFVVLFAFSMELLAFVQSGNVEAFTAAIATTTAEILNAADHNGFTLLHHAADLDEHQIFSFLFKNLLVQTEAKTTKGLTCLHIAASSGSLSCVKSILSNPNTLINSTNNWGETPLHLACAANHEKIVEVGPKNSASQFQGVTHFWRRSESKR